VVRLGRLLAECYRFLDSSLSWVLQSVETSGTSSSIRARLSSPLVTSSILFLLVSMKMYPLCVRTTADNFVLYFASNPASLSYSVSHSSSSSALLTPCSSSCCTSSMLNSSIRSWLLSTLPSLSVDRREEYSSISNSCWAIPEQKAVTYALAMRMSWDLAMYCGRGGCGAAIAVTLPPCCPCQATSQAYSRIVKNHLSGRYPDISPPFPPPGPRVTHPHWLRWTIPFSWLVCASRQSVWMCSSS